MIRFGGRIIYFLFKNVKIEYSRDVELYNETVGVTWVIMVPAANSKVSACEIYSNMKIFDTYLSNTIEQ